MPFTFTHSGCAHLDDERYSSINPATGIHRSWESHERALRDGVTHAIDNQHDAFLLTGDVFSTGRPTSEAILRAADVLRPLLDAMPLVLLTGDHDGLDIPSSQRTALHTLQEVLESDSTAHQTHLAAGDPALLHVEDLQILAVPWPSPSRVLEQLGRADVDPATGAGIVGRHVRARLEALADQVDTTAPLILAGHLVLEELRAGRPGTAALRGSEVDMSHPFGEPTVPAAFLDGLPVSYAALGHIHTRQSMGRVSHYAGSPDRFTLTDLGVPKSVNVVTISDDNTLQSLQQYEVTARPMASIDLADDDVDEQLKALPREAIVALRTRPDDPSVPPQVRRALDDAHANVVQTKVRSARTPAPAKAASTAALPERITLPDAVLAWHARQPEGLDSDRLVALALDLDGGRS